MPRVFDLIRAHALRHVILTPVGDKPDPENIPAKRFLPPFVALMFNRLRVGYYRYGHDDHRTGIEYDLAREAGKRLVLYQETGNLEFLVDAANYCALEFVFGKHSNRHFEAHDDSAPHAEKLC